MFGPDLLTRRGRAAVTMHLAVVACGNRVDETLIMVKSALLFSLKRLKLHIFSEDHLAPQFEERVRRGFLRQGLAAQKAALARFLRGLPLASGLTQRMLNIPPLVAIHDINIRVVLTLPPSAADV